jgi:chemotaxis protein MotB
MSGRGDINLSGSNGGGTAAAARRGRVLDPDDPLAYKDDDDTSWLIPYVDVISLLLAFLILTLAMSKVNPRKFELLTSTLSKQSEPPSLEELKKKVDEMLRAQKLQNAVVTSLDEEGLRAVFRGDGVLFESGQAEITPAGKTLIGQFIAVTAKTVDQRHQIAIEGHTDDVPIHTGRYDSNWELSSARATVVLKTFLAAGFDARRLSAQGFADTRPAHALPEGAAHAPQAIAKARADNRRVVIRVYVGGVQ